MNCFRYQNYENKNTEIKCQNNIQKKNRILQVKNRPLILEKDSKELRDLKEREIEEVFFESVIFSIVDINKFKEKDEEKVTACKKTWCNWLINYIPETMKNNWW